MCYFAIQDLASFAATSLGKRGKMENEDVNVFYPTPLHYPVILCQMPRVTKQEAIQNLNISKYHLKYYLTPYAKSFLVKTITFA